ncbi:molybdopterin synthase [Halobaculum sp. MBLA0147]|uniref:molybdopterin synthase n=1 Tax=Halobaculum sp. MBLA0147 TaxID=3079934 RepID=UPI003524B0E6
MQTLGLVGAVPPGVVSTAVDRLDGDVALVTAESAGRDDETTESVAPGSEAGPADTTVTLEPDGTSRTVVADDDVAAVLDRLAPAHDYALVVGASRLRLPTVVVGGEPDPLVPSAEADFLTAHAPTGADAADRAVPGDVVARYEDSSTLTPERVVDHVEDAEAYVTLGTLVQRVTDTPDADRGGAVATFTGRVRARDDPDDDRTTHLTFERYEGVAAERLATIESELTDREGVLAVETHHRTGVIPAETDIVFVVVLAGHREEAFAAVSDGIDRLKDEVPIFKRESTVDEEFWVHERDGE